VSRDLRLHLFRTMVLIRRLELKLEELFRDGTLTGSFHSSIGQEACAAGVCAALRPDDVVTSTHRGHGHAVAKGVPLEALLGELFGRVSGASRARGGSMHLHHRASGFLGENAIVAGNMPWAAGAAWARRRLSSDSIAVCFIGDGAAGQGLFYETLRLAHLWKAPCLFVCENNGFAHSMTVEEAFGKPGAIADTARALGIEAEFVDGRDVSKVNETSATLIETCRDGHPAFLECAVFRVRPHSLSDPDYRYRSREAGSEWLEENDPIGRLRRELGRAWTHDLDAIEREVNGAIDEAVKQARSQPRPDPGTALDDVYADPELSVDG
jgi:TPP-dependent pyruvate/acetoin dehydrogenase alpha subunit